MKDSIKTIYSLLKYLTVVLLGTLVLAGCQIKDSDTNSQIYNFDTVTEIEGEYVCTGECIVTDSLGNRSVIVVTGEMDTVQRYPGASNNLYQVKIGGGGDFHELELGALTGRTLRTATAAVSDGKYPVLEEYVFDTDSLGRAVGFTKIVRNPTPENFKTCVIFCRKNTQ